MQLILFLYLVLSKIHKGNISDRPVVCPIYSYVIDFISFPSGVGREELVVI